jgi:hypothetical protein
MVQADMDETPKESPGGENNRFGRNFFMNMGLHPFDMALIDEEPVYHGLPNFQVRLVFHHRFHPFTVEVSIVLRSRTLNGKAFSGVQSSELDAGLVRILCNFPAHCIDFFYEVSFRKAADGRIAAHGGDVVHVHGEKEGWVPHAGGGKGGFAAGVTGPHHNDIIDFAPGGHAGNLLKHERWMKNGDPTQPKISEH